MQRSYIWFALALVVLSLIMPSCNTVKSAAAWLTEKTAKEVQPGELRDYIPDLFPPSGDFQSP